MPKTKKVPLRMCVGCREMKPKRELLRVVKPQEGDARIDFTGKAAGRGAYVCKSSECLKRARKTRGLERALECAISAEVFASLEAQLHAAGADGADGAAGEAGAAGADDVRG